MRRSSFILGAGVIAALAAYCCSFMVGTTTNRSWLRSDQPELAWLKSEFQVGDTEIRRISQLHDAYLPKCEERCRRIDALNNTLTNAITSNDRVTADIEKLLNERALIRVECQKEMLKHFFAVSQSMPPAQGRRYMAWVQKHTCLEESVMSHEALGDADHRE